MKIFVLIATAFFFSVMFVDCTRNVPEPPVDINNDIDTIKNETIPSQTQTIHVFIENSGSMNGYINSSSCFQMAIGRAIQLMKFKYEQKNIKVYYINNVVSEQPIPDGEDIYLFVQKMLEHSEFSKDGSTSTDLNVIAKKVLGYVDEDNTAVLISDLIYSLSSTNGVTTNLLYNCQNLTMSAFLEKTKEMKGVSLATSIVQFFSDFNGKYWHWEKPTGRDYVSLKCRRPYYMCIMGTDDNIKDFNRTVDIESLSGYENQFTISNKDISASAYTVFDTQYKKGRYRHDKSDAIHSISKVAKDNNGEFELGIAIDLSDFTMSESDKLDPANYTVNRGNYSIVGIESIDTFKLISPTDKDLIRKNHCTHAIKLSCNGFPDDISISIKRQLPSWVSGTSSTDDRRIKEDEDEQSKTFGFFYFVNGISDAYNYLAKDKNNFMTLEIKVIH